MTLAHRVPVPRRHNIDLPERKKQRGAFRVQRGDKAGESRPCAFCREIPMESSKIVLVPPERRNMKSMLHCLFLLLLCGISTAEEPNTTKPAEKDAPRHTGFLADIKKMNGNVELVFVGDSI